MSEKRYFKIEYDEEWYLFDSTTISEQLVKEQAEYGYGVFANSLSPSEVVGLLNKLYEENERLRNQLERKTILLKIRTKHIDDRAKSFHELLNYLESFCYKSNIDGNYAKQDIINILNNWEIREYD